MEYVKLNNGIEMPYLGIGTWQITDRDLMKEIIKYAYNEGYRLIDTAAAYSNEISIAKAITETGIPRNELILSDKVWNTNRGYKEVQEACRTSLKKLKTDYLDVYLIHWPAASKLHSDWVEINADTWRGMERLLHDGLVRTIGVCNFKRQHLEKLEDTVTIMPMINQIEFHPGMLQSDIYEYCVSRDIILEGSSPLGNGQVLSNAIIKEIAHNYRKTPAQICIRWAIQKNIVVIPKTIKIDRLKENKDVFDFEISIEDIERIDRLPYCGGLGIDSDEVIEFG